MNIIFIRTEYQVNWIESDRKIYRAWRLRPLVQQQQAQRSTCLLQLPSSSQLIAVLCWCEDRAQRDLSWDFRLKSLEALDFSYFVQNIFIFNTSPRHKASPCSGNFTVFEFGPYWSHEALIDNYSIIRSLLVLLQEQVFWYFLTLPTTYKVA